MKTFAYKAAVALGTLSLLSGGAIAQDKITAKVPLKQKWNVGKTYLQSMAMTQTTEVEFGGQKQVTKMEMNQDSTMSVAQHENGTDKLISIKYDRIKMKSSMGGNVVLDYDSEKPDPANPATASLGAMASTEMKVTLDPKDEVKKVEGMEEIMKNAGAGAPMLQQMFSEDQVKSMMKQAGLLAPSGKPVGVDDTWPVKFEQSMGQMGKMVIEGKYVFKKMENLDGNQCAVLAFDGSIKMDLNEKPDAQSPLAAMGMKIKNGKMTGTTHFDPNEGVARKTVSETTMVMEMNNPQSGEKMSIPIKQRISLEIKQKK